MHHRGRLEKQLFDFSLILIIKTAIWSINLLECLQIIILTKVLVHYEILKDWARFFFMAKKVKLYKTNEYNIYTYNQLGKFVILQKKRYQ